MLNYLTNRQIAQTDAVISTARNIYSSPAEAWANLQDATFALDKAYARASGITGVVYDRDRVQSSAHSDMSDKVGNILELEARKNAAEHYYLCSVLALRYCLQRALDMKLFTEEQCDLWRRYYEHGREEENMSLLKLANKVNLNKDRVRYLVRSEHAIVLFCKAVESVLNEVMMDTEPAKSFA